MTLQGFPFHFDVDPDPAFHFDAVQIRIQFPKMMRIHADSDPYPQYGFFPYKVAFPVWAATDTQSTGATVKCC
jgi:hypothetical protein